MCWNAIVTTRLGTIACRSLLQIVCMCNNNVCRNKLNFLSFLRKRCNVQPARGPFHFRAPSKIFNRCVRGKCPVLKYFLTESTELVASLQWFFLHQKGTSPQLVYSKLCVWVEFSHKSIFVDLFFFFYIYSSPYGCGFIPLFDISPK